MRPVDAQCFEGAKIFRKDANQLARKIKTGILEVYSQLYLDDGITATALSDINLTKEYLIKGFPTIAAITTNWGIQLVFKRHLHAI